MRLFAAIDVGVEVREAAAAARRVIDEALEEIHVDRPRVVWMVKDGLHVTLRFFGEQPAERAAAYVDRIERPFPLAPFLVEWRGVGAFPSPRHPRVFWMGAVGGARGLGLLEAEMAERFGGIDPADRLEPPRPFHAHVTLGRVKVPGRPLDWPEILERAAVGPVRSVVDRVTLYRSRGLPGGAGYEPLAVGRLEG
jgi:2'-5' RNA ligase